MVYINIAHAQVGKDLGAGKVGGVHVMALCQKKDCTNESLSPRSENAIFAKNVTKILWTIKPDGSPFEGWKNDDKRTYETRKKWALYHSTDCGLSRTAVGSFTRVHA